MKNKGWLSNYIRSFMAEHFISSRYMSPPASYEHILGLNGLSRNWRLPNNIPPDELETRLIQIVRGKTAAVDTTDEITDIYLQITELNPDLATIELPHGEENKAMIAIIHGALSKMNFDDINYFVTERKGNFARDTEITKKLLRETGVKPQWVISPQTLASIERQTGLSISPQRPCPSEPTMSPDQ